MPQPSLGWMAQTLGLPMPGADAGCDGLVIDSRAVRPGQGFVALSGGRSDGHAHVAAAAAAGATLALVERRQEVALPQLVVPDSLAALQALGAAWRQRFNLPVVGITGSNGKTTTRQLVAAVAEERGPVCATDGNLNNHIGVPLTLLRLRAGQATAVIEMGASHPGEIATLAGWARPDIAVITQAGDAHLEGFGSREGVARAKGELYQALGESGIAVINADDAYAGFWAGLAAGRGRLHFGLSATADVRAEQLADDAGGTRFQLLTPMGDAAVRLPLPGQHNVRNALAAAAVGCALGLPVDAIAERLAAVVPVAGRLRVVTLAGGARLADDSYNANPDSMRAGIDWLARQPGERWAVLGHMAELGSAAEVAHRALGAYAAEQGIERCVVVGPAARGIAEGYGPRAEVVDTVLAAVECLGQPPADVTLLVKGSRSARMDGVVVALTGSDAEGAH